MSESTFHHFRPLTTHEPAVLEMAAAQRGSSVHVDRVYGRLAAGVGGRVLEFQAFQPRVRRLFSTVPSRDIAQRAARENCDYSVAHNAQGKLQQ
jgi:hypothetical protein